MKKIIFLTAAVALLSSCSNYLDVEPRAVLNQDDVSTAKAVDGDVTAAYASLGNDHYDVPFSLWPYGNVRSGDAYKGGRDPNDISEFGFLETFKNVNTTFGQFDALWYYMYCGISRANTALKILDNLTADVYPDKAERQAEMRYIRGYWYFQLKTLYKYVPYIDETIATEDYPTISNRALTNDALWQKIADDFQFAVNNLPAKQVQIGRPNKMAAAAFFAKTRLYQAYQQDEKNNVTSINTTDLNDVVAYCDTVINSQQYRLEPDFGNNFRPGSYENGIESIWAVQYSSNDGTTYGRLNFGDELAVPMGLGCCDFHKPSQNLANSYKTDTAGLPMFNTFNNSALTASEAVDPRIDHTIARPGNPYKYDPTVIYEASWNRTPSIYGYFASLKENVPKGCPCTVQVGPFYPNSKNRIIIRYADVLLWKAEALIELGRQNEALPLINQIRTRAANSTGALVRADGSKISTYNVGVYVPGTNCTWTQDFARTALRWERRLEFAMEGSRFFDLVRWGIADTYLNNYFATEKTVHSYLQDGKFTKNRDEYLPIPYNQINYSHGVYTQNSGY